MRIFWVTYTYAQGTYVVSSKRTYSFVTKRKLRKNIWKVANEIYATRSKHRTIYTIPNPSIYVCCFFFKNNELLLFIGTRIFHRLPLKIHIINRHSNNQIIYTFQKYVQINFWYIFFECHATAGGLYNPEMSSPPQPFPWKICAFSAFTLLC